MWFCAYINFLLLFYHSFSVAGYVLYIDNFIKMQILIYLMFLLYPL